MGSLAPSANYHLVNDLFAANRTLHIADDRSLILVDELDSLHINEHQLIKQIQTESDEILQILIAFDVPGFGD